MLFNLKNVHPSWHQAIRAGLDAMDQTYLAHLFQSTSWLPGTAAVFNAFSLPIDDVNYVLFGESPYPRAASANGYAFWDATVGELWSPSGLSKTVNRATSLRNIMKMLLVAEGALAPSETSQAHIAALNKNDWVQTNTAFFQNMLKHGFLLLNATLVLQDKHVRKDAKQWKPFIQHIMRFLIQQRPHVVVLLLGNIANDIDPLLPTGIKKVYAEHPYNISFILNPDVLKFFKPFQLLRTE